MINYCSVRDIHTVKFITYGMPNKFNVSLMEIDLSERLPEKIYQQRPEAIDQTYLRDVLNSQLYPYGQEQDGGNFEDYAVICQTNRDNV